MLTYQAPESDWKLLVNALAPQVMPDSYESNADLWMQVIESASKFHEEVWAPLASGGDKTGAQFKNGQVQTPPGYREAWNAYVEAAWLGASLPLEAGGWELPKFMHTMLSEMRASSAHSLAMYGSFCAPAAHMLLQTGDAWMKEHIVPQLSTGNWTATMCLTEAQCGSDLRQLRTQAWQDENGQWHISGEKIFISGGDHDLTDNIVHIVLAKDVKQPPFDAPGLENVRVFLVPKYLVDTQSGSLGQRNSVHVQSIEHKMGIEGSATCTLRFEDAQAWLIQASSTSGKTAVGMAPMFTMMNYARAGTAVSSVGHVQLAYQNAVAYAQERLAGRDKSGKTVSILEHYDVQRMLWGARSFAEGGRAALMLFSLWHEDAENSYSARAQEHRKIHQLLTPVFKAFFTDEGFTQVNACMQVYGGHGYIQDYGIEQLVRNTRIGQIYEGTNGIQSIDFVQRKLIADDWQAYDAFHQRLRLFFAETRMHQDEVLVTGIQQCISTLDSIRQHLPRLDKDRQLVVAYEVLEAVGIIAIAYAWAELLEALRPHDDEASKVMQHKTSLAKFWFTHRVSQLHTLQHRIEAAPQYCLHLHLKDLLNGNN